MDEQWKAMDNFKLEYYLLGQAEKKVLLAKVCCCTLPSKIHQFILPKAMNSEEHVDWKNIQDAGAFFGSLILKPEEFEKKQEAIKGIGIALIGGNLRSSWPFHLHTHPHPLAHQMTKSSCLAVSLKKRK